MTWKSWSRGDATKAKEIDSKIEEIRIVKR